MGKLLGAGPLTLPGFLSGRSASGRASFTGCQAGRSGVQQPVWLPVRAASSSFSRFSGSVLFGSAAADGLLRVTGQPLLVLSAMVFSGLFGLSCQSHRGIPSWGHTWHAGQLHCSFSLIQGYLSLLGHFPLGYARASLYKGLPASGAGFDVAPFRRQESGHAGWHTWGRRAAETGAVALFRPGTDRRPGLSEQADTFIGHAFRNLSTWNPHKLMGQ